MTSRSALVLWKVKKCVVVITEKRVKHSVIRELIPLKAETIKVADRRIIRDTADQLMEELVQMAGVVKEHRHTIARNDAEVKETKENTTKEVRTPSFSYADKLRAGKILAISNRVSENTFPVRIEAKKVGNDAKNMRKVVMRSVDPIKDNIVVKNVRATKRRCLGTRLRQEGRREKKNKKSLLIKAKVDIAVKNIKKTVA
ncbi:uncharacterized protein LOC112905138 isoform X3 [Agrilus planipennis]|uniref:Uncharacterized protein LOC112905138 isoform X3 n=1 Tax=Agrilus planipennis TaxID=224129 RepID=A0A7F5R9U0_AGRPL|nr:uncharacterized protein LOC112905138 isoform X3 [Agrilus planipennis]